MRHWPIVKTVAFIILVQGAVLVYLPVFVLEERGALMMPALSVLTVFAAVLWAFAVWVCISCAIRFALEGKGTPAPVDPPRILVVRGIYRFTRNPMYVGVVSALLAEALLFSQAALAFVALLCFMGFHLFVILYEEPHLRRVFGPQYEEYCRKVPRWAPLLGKWNRSRVAR